MELDAFIPFSKDITDLFSVKEYFYEDIKDDLVRIDNKRAQHPNISYLVWKVFVAKNIQLNIIKSKFPRSSSNQFPGDINAMKAKTPTLLLFLNARKSKATISNRIGISRIAAAKFLFIPLNPVKLKTCRIPSEYW